MEQLFQLCLTYQITPNQLYLLHFFRQKVKPPFINVEAELFICKQKNFITSDNKISYLGETILNEASFLFKKVKKKLTTEILGDNYQAKVKEYRELFPAGKNLFNNYTYRQPIEQLTPRFIWFFNQYPDYDWDLVLTVTKKHINDCAGDEYKYLGKSDLFIQRREGTMTRSTLASLCEAYLEEKVNPTVIDDFYKTV